MRTLHSTSLKASKTQQLKPSLSYWIALKQPPIAQESEEETKEKKVLFNRMFLLHRETVLCPAMHIHSGEWSWHERGTVGLVFYYSKYIRRLSKWTDTQNNQTALSSQHLVGKGSRHKTLLRKLKGILQLNLCLETWQASCSLRHC